MTFSILQAPCWFLCYFHSCLLCQCKQVLTSSQTSISQSNIKSPQTCFQMELRSAEGINKLFGRDKQLPTQISRISFHWENKLQKQPAISDILKWILSWWLNIWIKINQDEIKLQEDWFCSVSIHDSVFLQSLLLAALPLSAQLVVAGLFLHWHQTSSQMALGKKSPWLY